MKKTTLFFSTILLSTLASATTTNTPRMSLGVDLSQPYAIAVDGDGVNARANLNFGIDYRYFTNDNLNVGLRYGMDVETQGGSAREISIAPGIQYQWFQGQTWMPYIRSDLPVTVQGAANATGSSGQEDLGIATGAGLAWNLGNQIGISHLLFRYDFTVEYMFGFGSALNAFSMEFFKIGMDYRF
jgi:hypothetical protein